MCKCISIPGGTTRSSRPAHPRHTKTAACCLQSHGPGANMGEGGEREVTTRSSKNTGTSIFHTNTTNTTHTSRTEWSYCTRKSSRCFTKQRCDKYTGTHTRKAVNHASKQRCDNDTSASTHPARRTLLHRRGALHKSPSLRRKSSRQHTTPTHERGPRPYLQIPRATGFHCSVHQALAPRHAVEEKVLGTETRQEAVRDEAARTGGGVVGGERRQGLARHHGRHTATLQLLGNA